VVDLNYLKKLGWALHLKLESVHVDPWGADGKYERGTVLCYLN